jgi:hypothetical protein
MALSTKSPAPPLQQDKGANSAKSIRATVTGVDSRGQLFRDAASVVYLKGQKCIYRSQFNPSTDGTLMIELPPEQGGKEAWRSNAKIKHVSPLGPPQDGFRVTIELDRAHAMEIGASDSEEDGQNSHGAESAESEDGSPSQAVPAPAASRSVRDPGAVPASGDAAKSDHGPALAPLAAQTNGAALPSGGGSASYPAKSSPMATPAPKVMVTDIVRSVMASEFGQLKRDLQSALSNQLEATLQERLQSLETKMEQSSRARPVLSEETVRKTATQAAETVQNEWAANKLQPMVAKLVRSIVAAEQEQRQRGLEALVAGQIETAVQGPLAARIDAALDKSLGTRMEQHFRSRPAVTEETVRRLAVQAAQDVQTEWATTKLQKMFAEAMRQPLEAERALREEQVHSLVSSEIEAAVQGPVAARIDAMLKKTLEAQWTEHARKPPPITEETIRQIAASVAEHPQLQSSIDALAAKLTERWAEVVRGASTGAQQDLRSRMAASERLADQVVSDIQEKLNTFGVEMDRIFGRQQAAADPPSPGPRQEPDLQDREKRFREVLQSAGSQFEREMKAALQKIFGKM